VKRSGTRSTSPLVSTIGVAAGAVTDLVVFSVANSSMTLLRLIRLFSIDAI
jgi:hypothetical protein